MKTKSLPTLYKLQPSGKIEQWLILFAKGYSKDQKERWVIETTFGELDGKLQSKIVVVSKGKNIGKKNETSVEQQAHLEAKAKWEKKLKQGYVKSIKAAKSGKLDKIIKGGIVPMSALKWQDYKSKIKFPLFAQYKLDGERCVAIKKKGKITLWTRSRKKITACPHIIEQLETVMENPDNFFLDGELYKHGLNGKELEKLMGSVRKQKPSPLSLTSEFHIYDCGFIPESKSPFKIRKTFLQFLPDWPYSIKFVETFEVKELASVNFLFNKAIEEGYEGLMLRDPEAPYQNKRTRALLKFKKMHDAEFKIIDVEKGADKSVVMRCIDKKGETFGATMSGEKDENQKYLKHKKKYIGKMLTVQYQKLTGKAKVPLFPVGLRIRK